MSAYHFVTRWQMPGPPELIYDTLSDTDLVASFWPSLYKKAMVLKPGGEHGIHKEVAAETKGPLPYVLKWRFVVTECSYPNGYTIDATGDLVGRGVWKFQKNGDQTDIEYTWDVIGEKPLLKILSPLLRPLFALNHNLVMSQGEAGLRHYLQTRP